MATPLLCCACCPGRCSGPTTTQWSRSQASDVAICRVRAVLRWLWRPCTPSHSKHTATGKVGDHQLGTLAAQRGSRSTEQPLARLLQELLRQARSDLADLAVPARLTLCCQRTAHTICGRPAIGATPCRQKVAMCSSQDCRVAVQPR